MKDAKAMIWSGWRGFIRKLEGAAAGGFVHLRCRTFEQSLTVWDEEEGGWVAGGWVQGQVTMDALTQTLEFTRSSSAADM